MLINIVDVESNEQDTFIVSRNGGFVVVQPDLLVPVTSIMSQLWCERKAALGEIFKFPGSNLDALRGTIAHDIIGRVSATGYTEVPMSSYFLYALSPCNRPWLTAYRSYRVCRS